MRFSTQRPTILSLSGIAVFLLSVGAAGGQETPATPSAGADPQKAAAPPTPSKVEVAPTAGDAEIASRLQRILSATGWFHEPRVRVDEGVVFLTGVTDRADYKQWAGDLAAKTQDVVAVVNNITLTERSAWDLAPAQAELWNMWRTFIQSLPMLGLAVVLLVITAFAGQVAARLSGRVLERRMANALLRQVAVRAIMILVVLIGIYFVLRISGLTQIAVTVLGGTGLAGLIIGIAFQNIAENFLASILISMQRPFEAGDLVEVSGYQGYVQRVSARGTVLLTLDGNHVQVPNAIIYKSVIRNFTANPNVRLDFRAGLDYGDSISKAQEVAMGVLEDHPAVLPNPEPLVLVEDLADAKVYLRIYFWVNIKEHSYLKVRSAVMRLVKKALRDAKAALAESSEGDGQLPSGDRDRESVRESAQASVQAEGRLTSERRELEQQARTARQVEQGADLLCSQPPANGKAKVS